VDNIIRLPTKMDNIIGNIFYMHLHIIFWCLFIRNNNYNKYLHFLIKVQYTIAKNVYNNTNIFYLLHCNIFIKWLRKHNDCGIR